MALVRYELYSCTIITAIVRKRPPNIREQHDSLQTFATDGFPSFNSVQITVMQLTLVWLLLYESAGRPHRAYIYIYIYIYHCQVGAPPWSNCSVLDHKDHYHLCSNLGVGIWEGCFIFDFASLPMKVARRNPVHRSDRKTSIIINHCQVTGVQSRS